MKYRFLIDFMLISAICFGQVGIRGSFIIAAAGKDGVIMAGDSRAILNELADTSHKTLAYYDSVQKVFPIGNVAMGIMGSSLIGTNTTYNIVSYYIQERKRIVGADSLIIDFLSFYKSFLSPSLYTQLLGNDFITIGYKNNEPLICSCSPRSKIKTTICYPAKKDDLMIQADPLCGFKEKYSANKSCQELAVQAEKSIIYYSKKYNPNYKVGGQVSVIKITKDGNMTWIINQPKVSQFKSFTEIKTAYNDNKLGIHYVKPSYKKKVDFIMNN